MSTTKDTVDVWRYGFPWGPMTVQRLMHAEGKGYALEVKTDHCALQIYVSEKGRVIKPYPLRKV